MKIFKLSLRTEIILNMTILMLAMIILVSILLALLSKRDIYLKKAEGSLELVHALSNMVEPVISYNKDLISEPNRKKEIADIVGRFFSDSKSTEITIADSAGRIIFNSVKLDKKEKVDDEKFYEILKLKTPVTIFKDMDDRLIQSDPQVLYVYFPITGKDEAAAGILAKFSLSRERYYAARSQMLILLSIILDALLFILFGSFLLSRVIVKPVKKLLHATEKIAEGNLSYRVESFSTKEIDSLSHSFNKMTKKLLESRESLQNHVESLEKVNLELKKAKDEVMRSEKMASVGRLAAGIAHEIGNPLGSILGYLDILSEDGKVDIDDYIKRIQKECHRIDIIVRELLDYSRKHKFMIEPINLNDLVNETCRTILHRKMFREIECRMDLAPCLPDISADKRQIQQVITNLIINSADAMEECEKREIFLSTETVKYDREMFVSKDIKPGDELVLLSVRDTGCGMERRELDMIFDPFYTTKEPGKGTGLGLAISLRIVESFGGAMKVDSEKGQGTTFSIYLPKG